LSKRHPQRSNFSLTRASDVQASRALAPVRVVSEPSANGALLRLQIDQDEYPVPPQQISVDYADVKVATDAVHLVFGKLDSFSPEEAPLAYSLDISFPYAQFIRQLYQSVVEPAEPGVPTFLDAVRVAQQSRGYTKITAMPRPRGSLKQGSARANAAAMFVYDDEACLDFFHLDAQALHLATKGLRELKLGLVMRVVTSPNVLAYWVESVVKVAEQLMTQVPTLAKEAAHG
jgi:hypothetical protein